MRRTLFQTIHDVSVMLDRERVGREASPTAGVVDSQTIKAPHGKTRGYDAAKKTVGSKRHVAVDTDLAPYTPSFISRIRSPLSRSPSLGHPKLEFSGSFRQRIGSTAGSHQGHRRHVADRPVRPNLIVVIAPSLHLFARIGKRQEPVLV